MTNKEILNNIKLVGDVFEDRMYLAITKQNSNGEFVETKESRELTMDEIINTIFYLSKFFLNQKNETTHTFHNSKEIITISIKRKE